MKKLLLRMLREVRSNFGQFLSIVLIIAVGSMLMAGMFSSIKAMDQSVQGYYSKQNMANLWVYFHSIQSEDVQSFSNLEEVSEIEGRYTINEVISLEGQEVTLRVHSITDINEPLITEGELPQNTNEIILDYKFAEANNLSIGSKILVNNQNLAVTGLCMNPEYAYKQKESGSSSSVNRTFGIAYTQEETVKELISQSEEFLTKESEVNSEIADAETTLNDAKVTLQDAMEQYNNSKAETDSKFADAKSKLQGTKTKLDESQDALNYQKSEIDKQFAQKQEQLDLIKVQQGNNALIEQQQEELNLQKDDAMQQITQKQNQLDVAMAEYEKNLSEFEQQQKEAYGQLDEAKSELDSNQSEINEKEEELSEKKKEAEEELKKAREGYQEILIKTEDADSVIEYAKKISDYSSSIKLEDQPSYVNVSEALAPIRSIAYVFPLIFFFVAALVAFISLSKMVENQRMQIAVMQAIGVSKGKIRVSFLFYSLMAALLGGIIFAILGNYFIPQLLIRVFVNRFELPSIFVPIYWKFILIPVLLAVVFCSTAAILATQKVLREIPAQAMRPKVPKKSKKIFLERFEFLWSKLSYANKLILRNIFLNKSRMLLSSIGIIGSVMLIFTGVSLRNSALLVVHRNANTMNYDFSVNYEETVNDKDSLKFDFPIQNSELTKTGRGFLSQEEDMTVGYQFLENGSDLITIFDEQDTKIPVSENSVIIPDTFAKQYDIQIGNSILLTIDDKEYSLVVTEIAKQFSANTIYICFDEAKQMGMDVSANTLLIATEDEVDLQVAADSLSADESIKNVTTKSDVVSRSKDMLKTLNATIVLILASAAILAITVIYNTTSISIFERTREYATLMVLGYHKHEVNRLTMVENLVLSVFGCLCGLPIGFQLFCYLAKVVSRDNLQLPKTFDLKMTVMTIGMTLFFSIITNLLLRKKIKNIILTEALKSVE